MKIKLCIFSIILLLLAPALKVFAKNPFSPPQNVQLFYQLIYNRVDDSLPKYKMFMMRDGKSYALLNDSVVTEGGQYDNMTVTKVTKKAVVLETVHGEKKVVVLEGLQSKLKEIQQIVGEGRSK